MGCCLRHARPTRSSTGTACAANVVHLHPRIWLSRVQSRRRQAPSATSVGCCRRRAPSASSVGELRRRAPSASSVGELRRRAPSASSVGELRRPVPSACAVGLRRRPAPSACAVGLRRRPMPIAESPLPPDLLMRYCRIGRSIGIGCRQPLLAMGLCASSRLSTLVLLRTSLLLCSLFAELRLYSRRLFVQQLLSELPAASAALASSFGMGLPLLLQVQPARR